MPRNQKGRFVPKNEVETQAEPEVTPVSNEEAASLFETLLARMNAMEAVVRETQDENARLAAELDEAETRHKAELKQVAEKVAKKDDINALPAEANNAMLRGDRPGSIEEELNAREVLARENKQEFDRERTRKILMGEPVQDLNKWIFNGHAFDTEDEMKLYKLMVERQIAEQAGKYKR